MIEVNSESDQRDFMAVPFLAGTARSGRLQSISSVKSGPQQSDADLGFGIENVHLGRWDREADLGAFRETRSLVDDGDKTSLWALAEELRVVAEPLGEDRLGYKRTIGIDNHVCRAQAQHDLLARL